MNIGIDARGINLYRGSGIGTYTKNLILNLINSNLKDNFNLLWTGNEDKSFIKKIPLLLIFLEDIIYFMKIFIYPIG